MASMLGVLFSTGASATPALVVDLIAGQTTDVGEVTIWHVSDTLYVKFETDGGWLMGLTHLDVATSYDDLNVKGGSPRPGKFDYKTTHDPPVDEVTYVLPGMPVGTELFIIAHADVCIATPTTPSLPDIAASLPDQVMMSIFAPHPLAASYSVVTVSGGTSLDGTHDGWCVDTDRNIEVGVSYLADVFSSYETLPEGKVEYPENLDLVNWILNQGFVGQPSMSGGSYTFGDVQRAIWALIEDQQSTNGLGPWSQARVDEILAAASANGEGFEPGCGDELGVILNPVDASGNWIAQAMMITIPVPCVPELECETAWGWGPYGFPKGWARYITYTIS
jgi:hypothetical protein